MSSHADYLPDPPPPAQPLSQSQSQTRRAGRLLLDADTAEADRPITVTSSLAGLAGKAALPCLSWPDSSRVKSLNAQFQDKFLM